MQQPKHGVKTHFVFICVGQEDNNQPPTMSAVRFDKENDDRMTNYSLSLVQPVTHNTWI